jgi:hypothetical protein
MLDAPVDAWYVWIGLSAASLAVAGVAIELPSEQPTGAPRVAAAIDEVATSPYSAVETVAIDADRLSVESGRIALETADRVSHAPVAYGSVVSVGEGRLASVLRGRDPRTVYSSLAGFRTALERARESAGTWRRAPERLTVRRVSWGEVDATLVG